MAQGGGGTRCRGLILLRLLTPRCQERLRLMPPLPLALRDWASPHPPPPTLSPPMESSEAKSMAFNSPVWDLAGEMSPWGGLPPSSCGPPVSWIRGTFFQVAEGVE